MFETPNETIMHGHIVLTRVNETCTVYIKSRIHRRLVWHTDAPR